MSNLSIAALAALFGFCGLIYEFVFAQSFTILFGQSAIQYALTIGLFLGGMGLGAKISESWRTPAVCLFRLQLALTLCVPAAFTLVWVLSVHSLPVAAAILGYSLCFAVGILTGAELPLLMQIGRRPNLTLGADYLGMLAACAIFPFVLLPHTGLFQTLLIAALGNAIGATVLTQVKWAKWTIPALFLIAFSAEPHLREWLSFRLAGG